MLNCVLKPVKQQNCPDSYGAEEMKNLSAYCVRTCTCMCACVCVCAPVQVRVEAPTLGERGVFFSILWGLRQGEREAEHWEVQQLNSLHCATELGPGGHGVQHSSGALSIHTAAVVLWEGSGGGGGGVLHYYTIR